MWSIRLSKLLVREEADRCKSCSFEALLERDDGSTVYVLLLKRIPPVDDTFREEATPHFQTTSAFYNLHHHHHHIFYFHLKNQ